MIIKIVQRGRTKYVPPRVLIELENIKANYGYNGGNANSRAFEKMAEFVPVGMEVEKAIKGTGLVGFLRKRKR